DSRDLEDNIPRFSFHASSGDCCVVAVIILPSGYYAFRSMRHHIFCTCSSSRISCTVSSLMILPVRLWNAAHSFSASGCKTDELSAGSSQQAIHWKRALFVARRLAKVLLNLACGLLHLAFDLPSRIAGDRTGDVVGLTLNLLHLACCYVVACHELSP